jgi:hypothetical protein
VTKGLLEPSPRAALSVVRTIYRELQRQSREGELKHCEGLDENGRVKIAGVVDLAVLAYMLELALRREFPSLGMRP